MISKAIFCHLLRTSWKFENRQKQILNQIIIKQICYQIIAGLFVNNDDVRQVRLNIKQNQAHYHFTYIEYLGVFVILLSYNVYLVVGQILCIYQKLLLIFIYILYITQLKYIFLYLLKIAIDIKKDVYWYIKSTYFQTLYDLI